MLVLASVSVVLVVVLVGAGGAVGVGGVVVVFAFVVVVDVVVVVVGVVGFVESVVVVVILVVAVVLCCVFVIAVIAVVAVAVSAAAAAASAAAAAVAVGVVAVVMVVVDDEVVFVCGCISQNTAPGSSGHRAAVAIDERCRDHMGSCTFAFLMEVCTEGQFMELDTSVFSALYPTKLETLRSFWSSPDRRFNIGLEGCEKVLC